MGRFDELIGPLRTKLEAVTPHLNERQRRLPYAAEARQLGHGGIAAVAAAAMVSKSCIRRGLADLEEDAQADSRVRCPGAGRPSAAEKDPGLRGALTALVEDHTQGDPIGPLTWTTKSLRHLAEELVAQGHAVGRDTVAALLKEAGFGLRGNAGVLAGSSHPDRDAQFRHLNDKVREFLDAGDPVISVDAKKKEQIGLFAQAGREWAPPGAPVKVLDHDFPTQTTGTAIPYGIYDVGRNTGFIVVGTDHDTAAFAVAALRRWWTEEGRTAYPTARRLLVTAGGGSNSSRARAWKANLAVLATETGLEITVCHLPPGTSKWNRVEHRLFSFISMNWRARADQLRRGTEPDRCHHHRDRTARHRPPRQRLLPHRSRDRHPARRRADREPRPVPRRVELHRPTPARRPHGAAAAARTPLPPPRGPHLRRGPDHPPHPDRPHPPGPRPSRRQDPRDARRTPPETAAPHRKLTAENIIWAAVLDQRGLPCSLTAYLFRIGENQMRTLLRQIRPLLQQHGHQSEPLPVRLIDPCGLARYVTHATSTKS
ncbi:hypothetical protein P3T27_003281 [Kitasatospora sp. MAA19]|nr:hypothetical protein [Kitasatospora sp. MAA19]